MSRIAFLSFHLNAGDGVSEATEKHLSVFDGWGCETLRIAGYIPEPSAGDIVVPRLNHLDPEVEAFTERAFCGSGDRHELRSELAYLTASLEAELMPCLASAAPDLLVAENVFSMPLNIPLTMVLCKILVEEDILCIAVHHDFYWQLKRFEACALRELVASHFPPPLAQIRHATPTRRGQELIRARTGLGSSCLRHGFDFGEAAEDDSPGAHPWGKSFGPGSEVAFFGTPEQPGSGDSEPDRQAFLREFGRLSGREARVIVPPGRTPREIDGSMGDCHAAILAGNDGSIVSDLIAAVARRLLVLVGDHPELPELRDLGFQFLPLDSRAAARTAKLMEYPALAAEITARNLEIARRHFSMENLGERFAQLMAPERVL